MESASFLPHMNHVSVSPTNGNGPTKGQRKTLTRVGIAPTTFGLDYRCFSDWATRLEETLVEALIESWANPFEGSQDLVGISTAKVAPEEESYDFINVFDIGEQEFQQFKEERLESSPPREEISMSLLRLKK